MARTALAPEVMAADGIDPAMTAPTTAGANNGHTISVLAPTFLLVQNASAAAVTVTLVTPGDVGGLPTPDRDVSVPAGGRRFIPLRRYEYGSDVAVDYSAVASVTVAAVKMEG